MKKLIALIIIIVSFFLLTQTEKAPFRRHWRRLKLKMDIAVFKGKYRYKDAEKDKREKRVVEDKETGKQMRKPSKLTRSDQIIDDMDKQSKE